jgi:hypothetical protein
MAAARKAAIHNSGITTSLEGEHIVPASKRADGTARKEIKIRPGYVPEEDRERYKPPRRRAVLPDTDDLADSLRKLDLVKRRPAEMNEQGRDVLSRVVHREEATEGERPPQRKAIQNREGAKEIESARAPQKTVKDISGDRRGKHAEQDAKPKPPWHRSPESPPYGIDAEDAHIKNKRLVGMLASRHEATRADREADKGRLASVDLDSPRRMQSSRANQHERSKLACEAEPAAKEELRSAKLDTSIAKQASKARPDGRPSHNTATPESPPARKPQEAATGTWGARMTPAQFAAWQKQELATSRYAR